MPQPQLLQTTVWVSTSPKRAHSSCRPVASGTPQMHTSPTGRSARPRWIRGRRGLGPSAPTRDDCCAAVAHPDDKQHTRSVLERSRRAKTACRVRLMWRLLAGRRGRVVLHPGSGMRKASHERFFSHSPPPSSTGAEQSHPCMVGGWAEIASPRLPRDRLLILKTGPMSGRGIAETKCQEFAATEAALAPPWPRRVIDRLILARLPSAPERQGPRGHQLGGLQRHAVDEQHLER